MSMVGGGIVMGVAAHQPKRRYELMGVTTLEALFDVEQFAPQIVMNGDGPRAHVTDPVTSHLAADSITVEGRRGSQLYVLNHLRSVGRSAAWEIEERSELFARWSPSRIRTALKELEEAGSVRRLSGVGVTPRGRRCDQFEVAS